MSNHMVFECDCGCEYLVDLNRGVFERLIPDYDEDPTELDDYILEDGITAEPEPGCGPSDPQGCDGNASAGTNLGKPGYDSQFDAIPQFKPEADRILKEDGSVVIQQPFKSIVTETVMSTHVPSPTVRPKSIGGVMQPLGAVKPSRPPKKRIGQLTPADAMNPDLEVQGSTAGEDFYAADGLTGAELHYEALQQQAFEDALQGDLDSRGYHSSHY